MQMMDNPEQMMDNHTKPLRINPYMKGGGQ